MSVSILTKARSLFKDINRSYCLIFQAASIRKKEGLL